jgi:hypothetical protein
MIGFLRELGAEYVVFLNKSKCPHQGQNQNGNDETPEVDLLAILKREIFICGLCRFL